MQTTRNGRAPYMHSLPADITGVSCEKGEVSDSEMERVIDVLLSEAKLF